MVQGMMYLLLLSMSAHLTKELGLALVVKVETPSLSTELTRRIIL